MKKALTILLLVLGCAAFVQAAPPFESVLSDKTVVFIAARDVPQLQARFKEHALYDLWKEPSVQRFFEASVQRLKSEIQKAETETGVTLEEIGSLFHGQAALAIHMGNTPDDVNIVVMVDVGQDGERALGLVSALNNASAEKQGNTPATIVEETYEGARLLHLHNPAEAGMDGAESAATFGLAEDVFLVGHPAKAVKQTVTFLKSPPANTLANTPAFTATLNKVSDASQCVVFVNFQHILDAVNANAAETPIPQILSALGLNGLVSIGLGVELGEQFATSRAFMQTTGTPAGLMRLLLPEPGPLHDGQEAPADAASFFSLRFEPAVLWDEIEKGLAVARPEILAAMNMQIETLAQQTGQTFNLRNDLFAVFGSRMAVYTRYEKPYTLQSQQMVFLMDIVSKAAFDQAWGKLQKMAPQLAMLLQPQDYLGHQVYAFSMPTPPNTVSYTHLTLPTN